MERRSQFAQPDRLAGRDRLLVLLAASALRLRHHVLEHREPDPGRCRAKAELASRPSLGAGAGRAGFAGTCSRSLPPPVGTSTILRRLITQPMVGILFQYVHASPFARLSVTVGYQHLLLVTLWWLCALAAAVALAFVPRLPFLEQLDQDRPRRRTARHAAAPIGACAFFAVTPEIGRPFMLLARAICSPN